METLFEVVMATCIVDGSTSISFGAKKLLGRLGRCLQVIGKESRSLHAIHGRMLVESVFKSSFVRQLNGDQRK